MATEIKKIPAGNRAFTFTHDEIDKIVSALYMASGTYGRQFKELCERFGADREANMYWHNKSGEFYDMADKIKNGQCDI